MGFKSALLHKLMSRIQSETLSLSRRGKNCFLFDRKASIKRNCIKSYMNPRKRPPTGRVTESQHKTIMSPNSTDEATTRLLSPVLQSELDKPSYRF